MPSVLSVLLLTGLLAQAGEASARWRCEPAEVALGEPFELVLELAHPATLSGHELASGELALDESWVVLGEEPVRSVASPGGALTTRRAWRVASLESGARALGEALSRFALSERVTRIQVGEAEVSVRGVLAEGEDAPRPLREFPDDYAGEEATQQGSRARAWFVAAALLAGAVAAFFAWRRRVRRSASAPPATSLERLAELERGLEGERGGEHCFELTRLLRAAADGARARDRSGLTDEEWLTELAASRELAVAVPELAAVFERAARVKYAGEPASPWALQETFQRARTALAAVGSGGAKS